LIEHHVADMVWGGLDDSHSAWRSSGSKSHSEKGKEKKKGNRKSIQRPSVEVEVCGDRALRASAVCGLLGKSVQDHYICWAPVVTHACNPSYVGG
jgi:hypothetical protein